MPEKITKLFDKIKYCLLLRFRSSNKKEFFDMDGCGLEIEFGVEYETRCRTYIETGLRKIVSIVRGKGKFVTDSSIGSFLNVEIVLNPFERSELKPIFSSIKAVIDFYDNFVFNDNCGLHANFRADGALKEAFYNILIERYDSRRFNHGKYRTDFSRAAADGRDTKSYAEYIEYQKSVSSKYCGVNFLKPHLVEVRTLNLDWADVEFFYDIYEEAKASLSQINT